MLLNDEINLKYDTGLIEKDSFDLKNAITRLRQKMGVKAFESLSG